MNRLERWFLQRLFRKLLLEGRECESNAIDIFKEMNLACQYNFREANRFTIHWIMTEWFNKSVETDEEKRQRRIKELSAAFNDPTKPEISGCKK